MYTNTKGEDVLLTYPVLTVDYKSLSKPSGKQNTHNRMAPVIMLIENYKCYDRSVHKHEGGMHHYSPDMM